MGKATIQGFPKIRVGVYIGVPLFRETTILVYRQLKAGKDDPSRNFKGLVA